MNLVDVIRNVEVGSIQAIWLMPGVSDMGTCDRVGGRTFQSKMTTRDIKSADLARWMVWVRWHFRTLAKSGIHPPQGLTKPSHLITVHKKQFLNILLFSLPSGSISQHFRRLRNNENSEALKNNARLDK